MSELNNPGISPQVRQAIVGVQDTYAYASPGNNVLYSVDKDYLAGFYANEKRQDATGQYYLKCYR